ncbi:MAG: hypothetical protein GY811_13035 [Myxococcales bacterium]|nr:hypothetical protein [Myxococcales bacterium]
MTRLGCPRGALLGLALLVGVGACGSQTPERDTATLRYLVGSQPKNTEARLALARRAGEESRPGEALRELLWVHERQPLSGAGGRLLGELLAARGEQRLAIGDHGALADFRLAHEHGVNADAKKMSEARWLCAVAALRHSSTFRQKSAASCMAGQRDLDVRRRFDAITALELGEVEVLWDWFAGAGAKKRALAAAQQYVDLGGRDTIRLSQWRRLHHWWYGTSRPLLPVDAGAAAGKGRDVLVRFAKSLGLLVGTRLAAPETITADWGVPEWQPLIAEVVQAYRHDPALADRRAKRFADSSAYGVREAAILCELFYRLGDAKRVREWSQRVVDIAPSLPAAQEAAGLGHALEGNAERAGLFFTAAAAASGDGGETWARALRVYRHAGMSLPALDAGRKALGLTSRGWDMVLLVEVSMVQREMGRRAESEQTLDELWLRFDGAQRGPAQELVNNALNEKSPGQLATALGPIRHSLGF